MIASSSDDPNIVYDLQTTLTLCYDQAVFASKIDLAKEPPVSLSEEDSALLDGVSWRKSGVKRSQGKRESACSVPGLRRVRAFARPRQGTVTTGYRATQKTCPWTRVIEPIPRRRERMSMLPDKGHQELAKNHLFPNFSHITAPKGFSYL